MIEVSALQNFVSRDCGRRRRRHHGLEGFGCLWTPDGVDLVATSLHLSLGGGARPERGSKGLLEELDQLGSRWVKPPKWKQNRPRSPLVHLPLVDS